MRNIYDCSKNYCRLWRGGGSGVGPLLRGLRPSGGTAADRDTCARADPYIEANRNACGHPVTGTRANGYPNFHTGTHRNPNAYCDAHTFPNADAHTGTHCDANSDTNTHAHQDAPTYSYAPANSDA